MLVVVDSVLWTGDSAMVCKDEADLTALHGAGGAAVEDVEELRLLLHEDVGVAVAELGEVLLLATGEARP